jgi:hypothetical protein
MHLERMITDPYFFLAAIPAVLFVGISKGGLGAIALFGVPIMALAISPVQAAAIMLPILLVMDVVAIKSYWGVFDGQMVKDMLPAGIAGIAVGWATALYVDEAMLTLLLGIMTLLFTIKHFFWKDLGPPKPRNPVKAAAAGFGAGYTSFVSHAGAPPYQLYALPLKMDRRIFAGTSVMFFAAMNAIKMIPYFALGQFDTTNLTTSAVLMPLAFVSTLLGIWLVKIVSQTLFYRIMYSALFLVSVKLIWDGLTGYNLV